jgi:hypothetical protein
MRVLEICICYTARATFRSHASKEHAACGQKARRKAARIVFVSGALIVSAWCITFAVAIEGSLEYDRSIDF